MTDSADTMMSGAIWTQDGDTNESSESDRDVPSAGGSLVGFRPYGSLDSFNYFSPDSVLLSSSSAEDEAARHSDFISLVTAISYVYRQDTYLNMKKADDIDWTDLDTGSLFKVGKSSLRMVVPSPIDNNRPGLVVSKLVIKRIANWSMSERHVRSFNRELLILHHFQGTGNIVSLRGVGWFYNWNTASPTPEPVLMLEEAATTLKSLVSPHLDVPTKTLFSVFHDVAKGLSALHACGIVHGDVKVENVLLFPSHRRDEGIDVPTYIAKLSDFSLAVLDNGSSQRLPGGTPGYMAPESGDHLTFSELKLTDVYSLGVLYAVVASGTQDILSIRNVRESVHLSRFAERIIQQSTLDTEGSTLARAQTELALSLFSKTLAADPKDRDFEGLMRCFDACVEDPGPSAAHNVTASPRDLAATDLKISYGKFSNLGGHIKDQIADGLIKITCAGDADPRHPKACFELAVIYLSKYCSPTASIRQGLQYLQTSAEGGDFRAQALYGRLTSIYPDLAPPTARSKSEIEWLYSAAKAGYQIAQDDLATRDDALAQKALREYASLFIATLFSHREQTQDDEIQSAMYPALHLAVATGDNDALVTLLKWHPQLVNHQNPLGDTLLISACRFGQLVTASTLLRNSADASIANKTGENALHFLWRFKDVQETSVLLGNLLQAGADPEQEARPIIHTTATSESQDHLDDWNLVPKLHVETPIERLASYNRPDLLALLISHGCKILPRNGNQLRRMLLQAMRLQHIDVQELLIRYASRQGQDDYLGSAQDSDFLDGVCPLGETTWEYQAKRRRYLDAAVLGWVRQTTGADRGFRGGIDVPIDFWQICYHGPLWRVALHKTIDNALLHLDRRVDEIKVNEKLLDKTILLAVDEKAYSAFEHLMGLKILHTKGSVARLRDLEQLCWRDVSSRHRPHDHDLASDSTARPGESNEQFSILGLPVMKLNYIDQIYHVYRGGGTLAQRAVMNGDRRLFYILMRRFKANISLPFENATRYISTWSPSSGGRVGAAATQHPEQDNCYSAVALSSHQDLWFIRQFQDLNISFYHPYHQDYNDTTDLDYRHHDVNRSFTIPNTPRWIHPLQHALARRSWPLTKLFISQGPSLLDQGGPDDTTVLQQVLSSLCYRDGPAPVPYDVVDFLFPLDNPERPLTWWVPPTSLVEHGGYSVFETVYRAIKGALSPSKGSNNAPPAGSSSYPFSSPTMLRILSKLASVWLALLEEEYPDVVNAPSRYHQSVLDMTRQLQTRYFFRVRSSITFHLCIAPGVPTRVVIETSLPVSPGPTNRGSRIGASSSQNIRSGAVPPPWRRILGASSSQNIRRGALPPPWRRKRSGLAHPPYTTTTDDDNDDTRISGSTIRISIAHFPLESTSKFQPLHKLAANIIMGSPLDEIPLVEWLSSGLARRLYWPSIHHPIIVRTASTILTIIGIVVVSFLVLRGLWRHWNKILAFGGFLLVLFMLVVLAFFVFSLFAWILLVVVGIVGAAVQMFVFCVVGPSFMTDALFVDDKGRPNIFTWMSNL